VGGPCLQTTHLHKHWFVWKRGIEVPGDYGHALLAATAADRDAHALAVRASREDRSAVAAAVMGVATWWSGIGVTVALPTRDEQLGVGLGAGALALGGFAATVALALQSAHDQSRAIAAYNANCRR
jgi:hypothetical protein